MIYKTYKVNPTHISKIFLLYRYYGLLLGKMICYWLLSRRSIFWFAEKSKESMEIDSFGRREFAEIRRKSHWPSSLPMSSRVQWGRRARDRVYRKEAVDHWRFRISWISFSHFSALTVRIPLFERTGHTHTQTHRKVNWSLDIQIE